MQIANGILVLNKNHEQPVYNVTPAEAVVLHKLHFAGSQGQPLKDFVIVPGEAMTPAGGVRQEAERPNLEGKPVKVEITKPIERKRTAGEELARLRRAYFGTVKGSDGKSAPVVNVCFPGAAPRLPETFSEIEGQLEGVPAGFFATRNAERGTRNAGDGEAGTTDPELAAKREELLEHSRKELIELAKGLQIEVEDKESKGAIADKILAASKAAVTE